MKVITDAVVKNVNYKNGKVEIKLKDGRTVRSHKIPSKLLCLLPVRLLLDITRPLICLSHMGCRRSRQITWWLLLAWSPVWSWPNQLDWKWTLTLEATVSMLNSRPDQIFGWWVFY